MSEHLSHERLIQSLYGGESSHLRTCGECQAQLTRMESLRAASIAEPEVSHDFLAAQRRAIYSRMGERPEPRNRFFAFGIPAFAALALVAVGLHVMQPMPSAVPQSELGDAQLFSEVVSLEQTAEPRAAQPIVALFEDRDQ